jgi:ATP-binding protein involved in chromosome partitioning
MTPDNRALVPTDIRQADARHLAISWADGRESRYEVRALRLACCCAQCIDEWSGTRTLDDASVAEDVHPQNISPVGRYAIRIDWSDGHDTGIYSFRRLRELDEA